MLNRRHLAKSALLGGASAFLSTTPLSAQQIPPNNQFLDPHSFGAKGDGHNDDTTALQSAIDAAAEKRAAVFLPPGVYLTRELHLRPAVALTAFPRGTTARPTAAASSASPPLTRPASSTSPMPAA